MNPLLILSHGLIGYSGPPEASGPIGPANFELLRQKITAAFQRGWKASGSGLEYLPTAFDNKPFRQPGAGPWCRFAIREGETSSASIGRDFNRTPGFIVVQLFVPEDGGTKLAAEAVDKLAGIFNHQTITVGQGADVLFRTVTKDTIGKTGDGWWQVNAMCNFQFDERAAGS